MHPDHQLLVVIGGLSLWAGIWVLDIGCRVWMWAHRRRILSDLFGGEK